MNKYFISMEIAGPFAMWTRPDTGATPTSYPIPTWSAAKGIFESVAFLRDGRAWINPTRVEICKKAGSEGGEVKYQRFTINYKGPLTSKPNFQFSTLIISDVCYRLHASVENGSGKHLQNGNNPCHHLKEMFNRRLGKGQCYKTPVLGWNDFVPSYWGPLRDQENWAGIQTEVDTEINLDLVSILNQVFNKAIEGEYNPTFQIGVEAKLLKGEFVYA